MANYSYVVYDSETDAAVIVDPSWDLEKVLSAVKKHGLRAAFIINTHSHFDHVLGNEQMAKLTGARIIQHEASTMAKDMSCRDSDVIPLGSAGLRVMYTPGHSEDSICLICDGKFVLTGDTLFVGNCGRVDLPGGSAAKLYNSLLKLSRLEDSITVYPGHDYGATPTSTIGREKATNFVFRPHSEQEFVSLMSHGD